jgi:hypothetical protein
MTVYFWFYILLIPIVVILITIWYLSINVPRNENNRLSYIVNNDHFLFSIWIICIILILVFSGIIIFGYNQNINLREPFTHPGIFLFSTAILLLTAFFSQTNEYITLKYNDLNPLVFITSIFFLFMVVISSINASYKNRNAVNYSIYSENQPYPDVSHHTTWYK